MPSYSQYISNGKACVIFCHYIPNWEILRALDSSPHKLLTPLHNFLGLHFSTSRLGVLGGDDIYCLILSIGCIVHAMPSGIEYHKIAIPTSLIEHKNL